MRMPRLTATRSSLAKLIFSTLQEKAETVAIKAGEQVRIKRHFEHDILYP